jgi:hypothetical protein
MPYSRKRIRRKKRKILINITNAFRKNGIIDTIGKCTTSEDESP